MPWDDIDNNLSEKEVAKPMGWDIPGLIRSPDNLKSTHINWIKRSKAEIF